MPSCVGESAGQPGPALDAPPVLFELGSLPVDATLHACAEAAAAPLYRPAGRDRVSYTDGSAVDAVDPLLARGA